MKVIKLALISPSSTFDRYLLEESLAATTKDLAISYPSAPRLGQPGFINGSKSDRLAELRLSEQLDVDAIWAIRGGIGAIDLWHDYHTDHYGTKGPVLIGYSDLSICHFMRFFRASRIGIHGPNFSDLRYPDRACLEQISLLINKQAELLAYPPLKLLNHSLFDSIDGKIIPMNLVSLQSLAGSCDPNCLRGKILALEDINEPHYKIYRALQQLKNAGILYGIKALVAGHFNLDRHDIISETFIPLAQKIGVPLFDWPIFGHDKPNWPLHFGANCSITRLDSNLFQLHYQEQHDHTPIS